MLKFLDDGVAKETYEEEDKGERLEFEDEPEYEEEAAVDYDEKDLEQYEEQYEDGDEEVEYTEDVVEVETHMVDEELDEGGDDGEGEGYENADEEHHVDVDDEEHNEMVKEHRKRKEFEVFVGGLDKDATENDLRKVFGEVGEITEVRLMMNPVTKKNKGFAFLRYATVEQARRAVSELKTRLVLRLTILCFCIFFTNGLHVLFNIYSRCGANNVALLQVMTMIHSLSAISVKHGQKNMYDN